MSCEKFLYVQLVGININIFLLMVQCKWRIFWWLFSVLLVLLYFLTWLWCRCVRGYGYDDSCVTDIIVIVFYTNSSLYGILWFFLVFMIKLCYMVSLYMIFVGSFLQNKWRFSFAVEIFTHKKDDSHLLLVHLIFSISLDLIWYYTDGMHTNNYFILLCLFL